MPAKKKATSKKGRPYRVSGTSDAPEGAYSVGGALLWVLALAAWAFLATSLLSFSPADRPGSSVWPHNDPAANWCGQVGAVTAHHTLKVLGIGVIVPMLFGAAGLIMTAARVPMGAIALRLVGIVMLTGAACGLANVAWPTGGPIPGLMGGTAGVAIGGELIPRFAVGGTLLWMALLTAVGLLVACDKLLWQAPMALYRVIVPAAHGTRTAAEVSGRAAGEVAGGVARASGGVLGGLRGMLRDRKPVRVRLNDIDDEMVEIEPTARSKKKRVRVVPTPMEIEEEYEDEEYEYEDDPEGEYDEDGAYEEDDEYEYEDEEEPGAEYEEDEEEEDDAPGAPQVFTQDQLREKIAKLPVRFSSASRQLATEEDLSDLQNMVELEGYKFPTLDILEQPEEDFDDRLRELVQEQGAALESALQQYKIDGEVVDIESGPVITLYHLKLAPGTKVAALNAISSDIARQLKAVNIRIVSNMEGRDTVGVEIPNPTKEKVRLRELMSNRESFNKMRLPMFLGKDASGEPLIADLTKMPHMLIAGTTGSGKSVCMNTIIMSFLYTKKPNELKLVLVDPKMVEMSQFRDIPHLMCPVVTEMAKAAAILEWAVTKMDERYEMLADAGVRDIAAYNDLEWEELKERLEIETDEQAARVPRKLPYMVFIIDELADLMMTNKEVEGSIIRIAQKARAVGIHLILATQRPQANVVTGLIKSNMPCRIAFKVASGMDSRIVLDQKGGELLLGQGDMLYLSPSSHKLSRAQGTLVDDKEIRRAVKFLKEIASPSFERQLVQLRGGGSDEDRILESENNSSASLQAAQEDPMFDRAVEIVLETKRGSVSLLQRRLAIGYTRASRLVDLMGIAGIISDHKGSVARDVLITPGEWEAMKAFNESEIARIEAGEDPDQQALFGADGSQIEAPPFSIDDDEPDDSPVDTTEYEAPAEVGSQIEAEPELDAEIEEEEAAEVIDEEEAEAEDDAEPEDELEEEEEELEDGYDDEGEEEEDPEAEGEYEEEDEEEDAEAEDAADEEEEFEYEYEDEDGNPCDEHGNPLDEDGNPILDEDEEYEEDDEYEEEEEEEDEAQTGSAA